VADYSAKIKLIVDGLQSLKQVEERLTNLNRLAALDLGKAVKGTRTFGAVKKEVDDLAGSFSNLGKIVRGIAVGTGLGALTTSINGLSQAATALKFGGISKFAAALAAATGPAAGLFKELSALAIQFPVVAGTATVAGAALLAFSPQILRASNATLRLAKAAAEAGQPLSRLMASLASSGFRVDMFIDATQAVKIYQSRLRELSETVSVLSARQTALQTTLNKFNSESDTAAKIAGKLVDVTKRLNTEQQAQNDLLREAAGLRPESVERRATNTYNVTQSRKEFEVDQAADIEVVNQALDKLNRRNINWADALGISAMDAAAQKAEQLTARFIKNDKVVDSWITALYEGKQALAEINRTMEVERLDSYTRAVLAQQRALDLYTDTATQAKRAAEALNYAGETPALRPAGFTDEDVRIKNLVDDENTVANLIANNRKTQAALQSGLDAKFFAKQIEYTQKELNAELDKIETIVQAQLKADRRVQKDFDARLAARGKAKEGRNAMMQNVMIGGAFPMLFGGGAGAVLGGAAGGFIEGNPMMSIVTSALGTMVDEFAAAAIAVGAALMDTATTFDFVKEKSLFSSKELEKYATKLQEAGFVASASAVAQFDIIRKVGNKGVEDLATLASESDKLNRAFAELTVQMQAFIAGPLAVLLEQMAAVVGQTTTAQRAKVLEENLRAQGKTADADKLANRVQGAQVKGLGQSFNFSNFDPLNPLSLVAPNTKAIGNINEEIQGIINEFEKIELKPKIKLTPEQINKQDLAVLEKRLEAISIGKSLTDAVKQAAREQKDLDKQRADLVRSYEESIGSIRKKVEDEVSRRRFSILEKENQLLDLQGQNRIKQLQAANAQEIALAGRGERSEVASVAKEVAQIVADFTEQQLSAEEEAAKIKRKAALDARKFDFEAAQFKANIEKEVAKLNIETARKVADINEKVRSKNEETDSRKFDIEKRIAQIKLTIIETELKLAARAPDLEPQVRRNTEIMANIIGDMIKKNENMQPPAPLRGVGQVGGGGVSTTNFDAIVSKEKNAIQALVDEALKGIDLTAEQIGVTLTSRLQTVADGIDKALADIETREADLEVSRLRRIELVNAGLTEGVIQRVMELEQLKKIALAQYDIFIAQLESKIITEGVTTEIARQNAEYVRQIELIQQRKDALEGNLGTFDATTGTGTGAIGNAITSQAGKQIQEFITTTTAELNNLEQVAINVSTGIGNAIGNSLANGIMGLIEGTATAKEVFANFLRDVGQILIQEGTKMIATYIAIGIARIFAGLGGGGGDNAAANLGSNPNVAAYSPLPAGAKGATFANGIATFAKGGTFSNSIVSSPTLFKFADGGTTRTGLMGEAGPEAIMPLKRGADGSLGVQANGLREAMNQDRAGGSGSPVLNMSFQSTSINGTEYVSRDQLEQAMEQTRRDASRDGAKRGMTMTLDKLQQSPSTRSRVGMR
jgi:phage-related minor tail protein